ncbi:MAG: PKD domain-containing protein, partial [bacterium]|nr:PKD domain-containing protein [bacterium]
DEDETIIESTSTLEIASPINGTRINTPGPIDLSLNTDIAGITSVKYFVDNQLVEEVTVAPFQSTWEPVIWKEYSVMAKVYYNGGLTASVTPEIKVTYKNAIDIMFVVGNKNLTSEDQLIKSRLEQNFGFEIDLWEDIELGSPTDANPYDMVIISSSVEPAILGNDLESAVVPILTWEPFMFNRLRMTSGPINTGFGFTENGYLQVDLSNQTHPLAAGISGLTTELYPIVQSMPFGVPEDDAIVIASVGTLPILFGYDVGSSAGSRRVAFPLRDQFMHLLTDEGWQLFDAAVIWTLHGGDATTPIAPLPDISFTSPVDGELVNTPLNISFDTENWDLPSSEYKLRFKIDGSDRGLVLSDEPFIDGSALSEGPHVLTLQMERSNNFPLDLTDTIIINVTNDPLPTGPTAIIEYPFDGALVAPTFELEFSTFKWDILPGGKHVVYSIDGIEQGAVYDYSNISIENLPDGEHSITLSLIDELGVAINSEATSTFTVDQRAANLPESPFVLEYFDNSSSASTAEVKPVFNIVNDSSGAVNLYDFKIRYWYNLEHIQPLQFNVDYSAVTGVEAIHGETIDGYQYFETSFDNLGTIAANSESGIIQFRIHHTGYLTQDQSNDYSYDPAITSKKANIKATLYYQGELVWGLEPTKSPPPNQSPQIVLTSSALTGDLPHEVLFDASQSVDPDGTIVSYSWDFGDGNTGVGATASNTFTAAGTYMVSLVITDDLGAVSSTTLEVTVLDPTVNNPPLASLLTDIVSGTAPLNVLFDASGSSDPDGDIISFNWGFGDGSFSTDSIVSHLYQTPGTYTVLLTITDTEGASTSDSTEIVVSEEVNLPPIASLITSPLTGLVPHTVSFDATGSSDPEGNTISATWDFGDGTGGSGLMVDHIYSVSGTYDVLLIVSDGVLSDSTSVTVNATIDSGDGCDFNTPLSTPLPTFPNVQYDHIHVIGSGGPDVSNWTNVTVNWNLTNNGLYQFSVQTNNGQPGWWNDMRDFMTYDWASPNPSVTFTDSGFPGLDGEYWVAEDLGNLVLDSKIGAFSIYCSNSLDPPNCGNSGARMEIESIKEEENIEIVIYPSITQNSLKVRGLNAELESALIVDASGKQMDCRINILDSQESEIDVGKLKPGMYFLRVLKDERFINFRFVKQ